MNIEWNAQGYSERFSFVHEYGESVMDLLTVKPGSHVIDLGCGNGALTRKLAERGYDVLGIDASPQMIELARKDAPELAFELGDAVRFSLARPADAIFSNAVFHWIDAREQDALAENLARNLKPGGELVCEFGGHGNGERVHAALERCFEERGLRYPREFYFPTVGEHASLLEKHGLRVELAMLFDRPTPQKSPDGLTDWINMFILKAFEGVDAEVKADILREVNDRLRGELCRDGVWVLDYVRIRIRARKIA